MNKVNSEIIDDKLKISKYNNNYEFYKRGRCDGDVCKSGWISLSPISIEAARKLDHVQKFEKENN